MYLPAVQVVHVAQVVVLVISPKCSCPGQHDQQPAVQVEHVVHVVACSTSSTCSACSCTSGQYYTCSCL